jgi:hypothetical protein
MKAWTTEEDAVLRDEIDTGRGWQERVAQRLPGRTCRAAKERALRLGLTAHKVKSWFPSQERGRLRPGQASVARSRRRQAMRHHR